MRLAAIHFEFHFDHNKWIRINEKLVRALHSTKYTEKRLADTNGICTGVATGTYRSHWNFNEIKTHQRHETKVETPTWNRFEWIWLFSVSNVTVIVIDTRYLYDWQMLVDSTVDTEQKKKNTQKHEWLSIESEWIPNEIDTERFVVWRHIKIRLSVRCTA